MKRFINILLLISLLLAIACSKEDIAGSGHSIAITLSTPDQVTVKGDDTQGNTIENITIWAYPYDNDAIADNTLPSAYITGNTTTLTLNAPPDFAGKKYRFLAIANKTKFGKIYKARTNYGDEVGLELNENLTYKELVTAVFDAGFTGGIMTGSPGSDAAKAMPFTHWKDVDVTESTTSIEIPIYRSVAKTTFKAKLIDGSSSTDLHVINSVTVKSAHNYHIPQQGFVFSPIAEVNAAAAPDIFGEYNDVVIAQDINIPLISTSTSVKSDVTASGAAFLYENHNGKAWPGNGEPSPSSSDPNTYDFGAYYLEISYQYGADSNSDGAIDTPKSKTNYVPLPPVVRNRSYIVDATFDIRSGNVILSYSVKNWQQTDITAGGTGANGDGDDVQDVTFAYPTFEIWPVKTVPDSNPVQYDYSKPTAQYHATEDAPFQFYFRMQGLDSRQWTLSLADGNDVFNIKVDKSTDNTTTGSWDIMTITDNKFTATAAGALYRISIHAKTTLPSGEAPTANIIITYYASWLSGYDHLLINSGGGGTLWSDSGHERHQILVTQGADL